MKKQWLIKLGAVAVVIIVLLACSYIAMTKYAKDKYAPNTWVNGVYVTGRTPEEINQELLVDAQAPDLIVFDSLSHEYDFDLNEASPVFDYSASLRAYQKHQTSLGWMSMLWQENQITTGAPFFTYDEETLRAWWDSLEIVKNESAAHFVSMQWSETEGYYLFNNLGGHLDVEKGFETIQTAISERERVVDLLKQDCYFDYEMTDDQKKTYELWQTMMEMEECGLIYDMGDEKIVFNGGLISRFIAKDANGMPVKNESGSYYYDLEEADKFIDELYDAYHTYGVEREFKTSRESGDVVMVKPGNFGTEIDAEAEKAFLREVLSDPKLRKAETIHIPEYLHVTLHRGLDDTGGTYIEVDKEEQKIYFYMDGNLVITSGVVTGDIRHRHDTYEGAFCIQDKLTNRVLRGPGYASFVRRWMPVYESIGLHDADWRKESEFGGDTYKRNGSHGCVNMPDETTDVIFDNAEIGTPVFIFK